LELAKETLEDKYKLVKDDKLKIHYTPKLGSWLNMAVN
jgi:hypothetical protein